MEIKKSLDELLAKDIDRRQFLAYMGAAGLAAVGVSGLIKALTDPHGHKKVEGGYGGSAYGGGNRKLGQARRVL